MSRGLVSVLAAGLFLGPAAALVLEKRIRAPEASQPGSTPLGDAGNALKLASASVEVGISTGRAASAHKESHALLVLNTNEDSVGHDESKVKTQKYASMKSLVADRGTTLAIYEHRHYSVNECKALCDRHPACRSFTFGWGSTRSCSLQDQCVKANDTLVDKESPLSTFRTFYRSCSDMPDEFFASEDSEEPLFLFVGVVTAPGYFLRREYIRNAWMKGPDVGPGRAVETRFFVGEPKPEDADALQQEIKDFDDVVVLPVTDNYDNLTAKTLELLRWSVFYKEAKFVMKLDDDTYPSFQTLLPILRANTAPYSLHGHIFSCAPVLNFTKWAEKTSVYNQPYYPTYAQGSGYILSYELARDIGVTRYDDHHATMLHNEDASVGFWIRRDELVDINMKGIVYNDLAPKSTLYGCREGDILSMNLQITQMPCMGAKEARGDQNICCPEAWRANFDKEASDNVPYSKAAIVVEQELKKPGALPAKAAAAAPDHAAPEANQAAEHPAAEAQATTAEAAQPAAPAASEPATESAAAEPNTSTEAATQAAAPAAATPDQAASEATQPAEPAADEHDQAAAEATQPAAPEAAAQATQPAAPAAVEPVQAAAEATQPAGPEGIPVSMLQLSLTTTSHFAGQERRSQYRCFNA